MLRYARGDTHYLLYIYDLMKRKLLSSSTDLNCHEASLVELKLLVSGKSLLFIFSVKDIINKRAFSGGIQGLCEWRDVIAHLEDESTSYILPNKFLIEIGNAVVLS
ncbi:putative HRDC-like superfamily protein [Helianthus anomalus]